MQLYEEYPSRYSADVSRRHRWIRGDWQIAALAAAAGAGGRGGGARNPLCALSRWKIFDNLRRSLVPVGADAAVPAGWALLPAARVLDPGRGRHRAVPAHLRLPAGAAAQAHGSAAGGSTWRSTCAALPAHLAQAAFTLACLPYEAYFSLDAIVRTLWRMLVTRRRLLEWSASQRCRPRSAATSLRGVLADRCGSARRWRWPRWSISRLRRPSALAGGLRRSGRCGSCRPCIAWWISQPLPPRAGASDRRADRLPAQARAQDLGVLRDLRRPRRQLAAAGQLSGTSGRAIAHRTSPTNIGLPCSRTWPPTTSATSRPASWSSARANASTRCKSWSATAATSTTGTTRSR